MTQIIKETYEPNGPAMHTCPTCGKYGITEGHRCEEIIFGQNPTCWDCLEFCGEYWYCHVLKKTITKSNPYWGCSDFKNFE